MKKLFSLIILLFISLTNLNNAFSISPDVFIQSTVNRASQLLSKDISKDEKMSQLMLIAKETVDIKKIGFESVLSNKPEEISDASHLILPGVGAFGNAMKLLKKFRLDQAIVKHTSKNKPLLGICLGMQLLLSKSYEFANKVDT